MKKPTFLFTLLFVSLHCLAINFNEAVQELKVNNFSAAKSAFQELQKNDSFKAKASLSLALMNMYNGKYKDAFSDFKQFYENYPDPNPYLYALINSPMFRSDETNDDAEVIKFLQKVLDAPKTDAALSTCVIDLLGIQSEMEDDMSAARNRYAQLHDISNWSTLGSFENVSGSGFNKDFGVLNHPEQDYEFTNKIGQPVKWFDISALRVDHWMDMNSYHYTRDAIIYSQTFLSIENDEDVILMAGVSGSLKVWVNDFLVISAEEERNTNADVYQAKIKLQKGINRILVQTGSSEIDQNNFMIRLADKNGYLLDNLKSSPHYKPYNKATPYVVEKIGLYPERYFENIVASDSTDWVSKLLLLLVYANNQNTYPAHKVLAELQRMSPTSTMVAIQAIEIANADKDQLDANKLRESIKTNDPGSFEGLHIKFSDAVSSENYDEALDIIKNKLFPMGATASLYESLIDLYEKRNEMDKAGNEKQNALEKYPNNERIVLYKYRMVLNGTKDIRRANDILTKYLKERLSLNVIDLLIEGDLKVGNKADAEQLIKKEISIKPSDPSYYLKLARYYYEIKNNDKALAAMNNCISLCPYKGWYYYGTGLIYEAMGNKEFARKMVKLSIQYSPSNSDAREKLRSLQSQKKLKDYFKQNDAIQIYQNARKNTDYKSEDVVCLLNDHRQIVYPEQGAGEEQIEKLLLINSQSAISTFKEFYIPYNSFSQKLIIDKVELLKPDGNKVPAERQKGNCVFSSLEVGDAIHIYYRLENNYEGKLSEHFWNEMIFNNIYPTEVSRFSLIVPENKKFQTFVSCSDVSHTDTTIDGYRVLSWELDNLPKIKPEVSMDFSPFKKLIVTSIPDWHYVANWYTDISFHKTRAKFEVQEMVKLLMSGHENDGDLEKARIIYNYIEKNYNYSSVSFLQSAFTPQSATRTYTTKLGDCKDLSTLFVSMTREAGLNTNLILVRTNGAGPDNMELPSIGFNHCIAQLHSDNKDYLIEMTSNFLPFAAIPSSDYHAIGLPIPYRSDAAPLGTLQKLSSTNRPANANVRTTTIEIDGDNAVVHRTVNKTGVEAAGIRANYRDADVEQRLKNLTTSVHKEFNKEITIQNMKMDHLKDLNDTVHLEYDVDVSHFSSELLGMKVFRLPWTDANMVENLFSLSERKLPLNLKSLSYISYLTEQIEVAIPTGKKLAERPKDVHLTDSVFDYSLTFEVTANKLVAVRNIKVLKDSVAPEDYTAVRDIANKISQADQMDLALK